MAAQAKVDLYFVLNKVEGRIEEAMVAKLDREKIIAKIPHDDQIFMESFQGEPLTADLPAIDPICQQILKRKKR